MVSVDYLASDLVSTFLFCFSSGVLIGLVAGFLLFSPLTSPYSYPRAIAFLSCRLEAFGDRYCSFLDRVIARFFPGFKARCDARFKAYLACHRHDGSRDA